MESEVMVVVVDDEEVGHKVTVGGRATSGPGARLRSQNRQAVRLEQDLPDAVVVHFLRGDTAALKPVDEDDRQAGTQMP
jgi:hypothetical protein